MTYAAAHRRSDGHLQRLFANLTRFPARTVRSVVRLFDPNYELERLANRETHPWLRPERHALLTRIAGMSSTHEWQSLSYLAHTAPTDWRSVKIGDREKKSPVWLVEGTCPRGALLPVVGIDPHQFGSWDKFTATAVEAIL